MHLLSFGPGPLPGSIPPLPPIRFIIDDNPYDWLFAYLAPALGFVQFVFLFCLTVYTFRSAAKQKLAERKAAWYHKVVVDFSITNVSDFVERSIPKLESLITEMHSFPGYSNDVRDGFAEFKGDLSALLDALQRRLECFPKSPVRDVSAIFLGLEDEVAEWFDPAIFDRQDVRRTLNRFQGNVLGRLRDFEFNSWH
jgi:hypothetical protein